MLVSLVLEKVEVGIIGMNECEVDQRKVMIRSGTGRSSSQNSKVVTVAAINSINSSKSKEGDYL